MAFGVQRLVPAPDRLADPGGHARRRLAGAVHPHAEVDLGDGRRVRRVERLEAVHLGEELDLQGGRVAVEAAQAGSDPDDRRHAVRVPDGRVDRVGAAARVAHQRGPADPHRVEHGDQVVRLRELDVVGGRLPPAARVVADDAVAGRDQQRSQRVPALQAGDPGVHEHDRRSGALVDDPQPSTRHLDERRHRRDPPLVLRRFSGIADSMTPDISPRRLQAPASQRPPTILLPSDRARARRRSPSRGPAPRHAVSTSTPQSAARMRSWTSIRPTPSSRSTT